MATTKFFTALSGPTRRWNPYSEAMVRSEFKDRMTQAMLGNLKPVDQVKPVDTRNPPPLYEIRWQDVAVVDVDPDDSSKQRFSKVLVRLYHSEPQRVPGHFVGHHVHEKDTDGNINADQDVEIATAKSYYDQGIASDWGIT